MKKILFTLAMALCSLASNAQVELIDVKYDKMFTYDIIAFDFNGNSEVEVSEMYDCTGKGLKFSVKYDDFDTAGNLLRVAIEAPKQNGKETSFVGLFEDVIFTRERLSDGSGYTYIAINKFKEPIFFVNKGKDQTIVCMLKYESLQRK